jgi:hypothetical protein
VTNGFPISGDKTSLVDVRVRPFGHHADVRTGCKRFVAASDDNRTYVRVTIQTE